MPCSDRDPLHSDELRRRLKIPHDLQAQLDRLSNPNDELIKRTRLSMATGQLRNARNIVPLRVTLYNDAELASACSSHESSVLRKDRACKAGKWLAPDRRQNPQQRAARPPNHCGTTHAIQMRRREPSSSPNKRAVKKLHSGGNLTPLFKTRHHFDLDA